MEFFKIKNSRIYRFILIITIVIVFLTNIALFINNSAQNPQNNTYFNQNKPNNNLNENESNENLSIPPSTLESSKVPNSNKYLRQAAYGYAKKWYSGRNPHYKDYSSSGGDCANFVSQCLIAGGLSLYKGTNGSGYGVYPDVDRPSLESNGSIPFCDYLNLHLRNYQNTSVSYVENTNASIPSEIDIGDVIIFGDKTGDKYKHAMIIVWKNTTDVGLAGHSSDVWNRSFWVELGYFSCATFYHIIDEPAQYFHFRVNTGGLNVRVGIGKNELDSLYQSIGIIHQNEEYIAFEYAFDQDNKMWWHFWFDDRTAWCASWYTINVTAKTPVEVDVSNYLNVRDGPSTSYAIFGQVFDGMRFVSDFKNGSWYRFYYSGYQKYFHEDYVIELDEYEPIPDKNANKTVLGFLPYWVSYSQNWTPLTHLAWFSVELNADGTIGNTHGWPLNDLVDEIHGNNTSVLLTVTMFDSTNINNLISNSAYRTTAISNLLTQVQLGNADGICIDFEHPKTSGDEVYLVNFMSELNSTFKTARSDYYVSLCTPSVDWWGTYDYENLAPHVDSFMLMGYSYYYSGSSTAGPTAPLYGGSYNLNKSVYAHINGGAPRSKIVLGLPFYGYDYPVVDTSKHSSTRASGSSITYSSNMNKKESISPTLYYDATYECEWYNYYQSGDGWHQVWCENNHSLAVKMDYINNQNLGGLGIWAWGYQGSRTELEDLIIDKFYLDVTPPNINITTPNNNDFITSNPVNISWTGSDNVAIAFYEISINNGSSWINVGLNTSYQTIFPNGSYQIIVRANDTSNNTASDSINITVDVDILAPSVSIISPLNEETITSNPVNISWTGSDNVAIAFYEISINNGSSWINVGLNTSYQTVFPNGTYQIIVRANDTSNNTASDSVNITVDVAIYDVEPPSINIISPLNGSELLEGLITVQWNFTDNIGVTALQISWNSGLDWQDIPVSTSMSINLSTGEYILFVKAFDSANNFAIDSVYFTVLKETTNNNNNNNDYKMDMNKILLILVGAVGASLLITIVIIRRKMKKEREDPDFFIIET
ncbi:MAG: glycosyl hydrolase family 18 protein [Promethearchaeota archaeon]